MNIFKRIIRVIHALRSADYKITVTRSRLEKGKYAPSGYAYYVSTGQGPKGVYRTSVLIKSATLTLKDETELIQMLKDKMIKHISKDQ